MPQERRMRENQFNFQEITGSFQVFCISQETITTIKTWLNYTWYYTEWF